MQCSICCDKSDSSDAPSDFLPCVLYKCAHIFCFSCIKQLRTRKCPYCRLEFEAILPLVQMVSHLPQAVAAAKTFRESPPPLPPIEAFEDDEAEESENTEDYLNGFQSTHVLLSNLRLFTLRAEHSFKVQFHARHRCWHRDGRPRRCRALKLRRDFETMQRAMVIVGAHSQILAETKLYDIIIDRESHVIYYTIVQILNSSEEEVPDAPFVVSELCEKLKNRRLELYAEIT